MPTQPRRPVTLRRCAGALVLGACVTALLALAPQVLAATESGKLLKTDWGDLYYEVRGGGTATPLLVVNGGPGFPHDYVHCSEAWDDLAARRRVIFYDQRGTGRSSRLAKGASCTLADQIADLEALRQQLGLATMDLLGHSWGGYLVMAYAARHPERIAHLVIVDSAAPKWDDTVFLFKDVFPEGTAKQQTVAFAEALGDAAAADTDLREYFAMLFYSTENRDRFMATADTKGYQREVNETLNQDLKRYDLNPELPRYRMPTLVVTGRYDMNVAPSVAWKIHQAIPGSTFRVFEKSGHIPYFEERPAFVATLEEFLARPADRPEPKR
jgi:proline iminopeptidase